MDPKRAAILETKGLVIEWNRRAPQAGVAATDSCKSSGAELDSINVASTSSLP